jgi:hypothetical protein
MSDLHSHHHESSGALFSGYLTDGEAAAERGKSTRTLRAERQRGSGPPYVKDGRLVLYPIDGFRAWLRANERHAVRKN